MPGLHDGLLLRLGTATSYASVRPGTTRAPATKLPESRELREVRASLMTKTDIYRSMQRALQLVAEREGLGPDVGTTPARVGAGPADAQGHADAPGVSPLLRRGP